MNTTITNAQYDRSAPIVRTNLSRFGIFVDVPRSLAALIIDIFDLLPDPAGKKFPAEIAAAVQPGADLSRVPALFLRWLLTDAKHGAITLSRRDDVKEAMWMVVRDVLTPISEGRRVNQIQFRAALLVAQVAQLKTWHDYERAQPIDGLQPRIEWMIATAATDAMRPYLPEQLVGAVHSCAVAWNASQYAFPGSASFAHYLRVKEEILSLLAEQPGPKAEDPGSAPVPACNRFDTITARDRVAFDDPQDGPQTGTVIGILNESGATPTAVVNVDHNLDGVTWNVPLAKLRLLEAIPA